LCSSDIVIRSLFARSASDGLASSPLQGALSFILRKGDPLTYYQYGYDHAAAGAAAYEQHLGGFPPGARAEVTSLLQQLCLVGQGLSFRDAGRMAECRSVLAKVSRDSTALTRADAIDVLLAG
jgi:hypothetical protein